MHLFKIPSKKHIMISQDGMKSLTEKKKNNYMQIMQKKLFYVL